MLGSGSFTDLLQAFGALPPEEKKQALEFAEQMTAGMRWVPNPGPQTQAYFCEADELFYGGAGGGGKTALLCGLAVNCHQNIHLFRREGVQLRGLINELTSIFGHTNGFNSQLGVWRVPDSNQIIELAGIKDEDDKIDWQGRAGDYKGFDEITHFCLHPDTEVLTDRGWVSIADVTTRDRVLAMSADRSARYERVTATHAFDYSGQLIGSRHRSVRYWVTPNHKMVVSSQRSDAWRFVEARDLPDYALYPFSAPWQGQSIDRIQLTAPAGRGIGANANVAHDIDARDWAEFLGWYLAEGSCFETGPRSGPRISIRQTKRHAGLDALMERMPWRSKWYDGEGYAILSRQLFSLLKPLGNRYEKRVPRWILDGDIAILEAFWRGFVAGDGSVRPNGSIAIGLCNKGLRDDCQEIATKLGHRSTAGYQRLKGGFDVYRLHVHGNTKRVVWEAPEQRTTLQHDGKVYCLTVEPSHTFLIRVDGRVMWTGNSRSQYEFIIGWNRPGPGVPPTQRCRVVATGNPPIDESGLWVMQYWAPWLDEDFHDPAAPGELRWPVRQTEDEEDDKEIFFRTKDEALAHLATFRNPPRDLAGNLIPPRSRSFIPAFLEDNPDLMRAGYAAVLDRMPKELRDAMRHGKFKKTFADDEFQVIPTAWIVEAQARWTPDRPKGSLMTAMGVDIAQGGADRTVIAPRYGDYYPALITKPGRDTPDGPTAAALIILHLRDAAVVNIDLGGGWGGSAYDHLKGNDAVSMIGIVPGGASQGRTLDGKLGFKNVRAEMWWRFREALDPSGEHKIALPPDPELRSELAAPKWKMTSGSLVQLEEKADIKKRLGRSPDKGDAVVMSWFSGNNRRRKSMQQRRSTASLPSTANLGGRKLHSHRVRQSTGAEVYTGSSSYRDEQG